jgi:hypothetical protein
MRRTSPFHTLAVTASLGVLLLSGCSDDDPAVEDPTAAPTTSESPSVDDTETTSAPPDTDGETATADPEQAAPTGPVLSDDEAFEVTAPEGWLDVTSQVEQKVQIALRDDEMTDDFYTNIVVASEDPIEDLAASIEEAAQSVAGTDGDYEMLDPIEIDGEEAHGYVLTRTTSGVAVAQTQRWVEHGDRLYVITFSSAKGQQEAAEPVMEEIFSSWTWQD